MATGAPSVAVISLEPWDDIWRRNQHLIAALMHIGAVSRVLFIEPPSIGLSKAAERRVMPGVLAVSSSLRLPKRAGGYIELGARLRPYLRREADILWVNAPDLGAACLSARQAALYDVTDDWRTYPYPTRVIRRLVHAEDKLSRRAETVVCSEVLQRRWVERYGIRAAVVHNGIDANAWKSPSPRHYDGPGPHVGYIGTLQPERLDIELVLRAASDGRVGTLHLVGPDALDHASRNRLAAHHKIKLNGPVSAVDVPAFMSGFDVLISPHRVTPFTMSLDAIKSYEYLASGRPMVATPTSGFQTLAGRRGVYISPAPDFVDAIGQALREKPRKSPLEEIAWETRAREFAKVLVGVGSEVGLRRSARAVWRFRG